MWRNSGVWAVLAVVLAVGAVGTGASLVNEDVTRTINAQTHLTNVEAKVTVKNAGSAAVHAYQVSDANIDGVLAFVSAKFEDSDDELPVRDGAVQVNIAAGKSVNLVITQVYTHAQKPFPTEIHQKDDQLVKFTGNLYFASEYPTTTQKTSVVVPGRLESFTKSKPYSNKGQELSYGPYTDVKANAHKDLSVHFESYTPFLTVTKLVREVTVSHWGYASISEDITIVHSGAKLVGEFSRLDLQRDPRAGRTALRSFTTRLPAAASGVNYRDVIGNISTSNLREEEDAVIVEIQPRFPLFGGWKTQYSLAYDVPSGEILSTEGSTYVMSTRFVGHVFDNQVVDEAEVRVVLPEGAADVQVNTPFPVDEQSEDVKVTYFDTTGRSVIVLKKANLVEEHMQDFTVSYTMPAGSTVREPLMAVAFFFALFVVAIVLNRVSLSIAPDVQADKKKQ